MCERTCYILNFFFFSFLSTLFEHGCGSVGSLGKELEDVAMV